MISSRYCNKSEMELKSLEVIAIQNGFLVQLYYIGFYYASNPYTSSKAEWFYQGIHFRHFFDIHGSSV